MKCAVDLCSSSFGGKFEMANSRRHTTCPPACGGSDMRSKNQCQKASTPFVEKEIPNPFPLVSISVLAMCRVEFW